MFKEFIFSNRKDFAKFRIDLESKKMFLWSPLHKSWLPHKENQTNIEENLEEIKEKLIKEFGEMGFKLLGEKDVRV
jgi:hypothetical protein